MTGRRAIKAASPAQPRPAPSPVEPRDRLSSNLAALLKLEEEVRSIASLAELQTLGVNEAMRLTGARQVFLLEAGHGAYRMRAVSSLATFDAHSPLVQAIERGTGRAVLEAGEYRTLELASEAILGDDGAAKPSYPFRWMMLVPLAARGRPHLGALLLARDTPWTKSDLVVAERLARMLGAGWAAIDGARGFIPRWERRRAAVAAAAVAAFALLMALPVPMTTLAPFEIGSRDEQVIAAPVDGVIEAIEIEANAQVRAGDILVRMNDTVVRNRLEVAEREVAVAAARLAKTEQLAFGDLKGRHELSIARTELMLKTAERDWARDLLDRTVIRAPRPGVAVLTDKRELIGKPVATGERILAVADPATTEVRIDVPVADALMLRPGARTKVFLDTDPLWPREASVRHADYLARLRPGDMLAFRVVADFQSGPGAQPRLGARGTAQLFGDNVPLGFYLFRRPLSALRQRFGI